MKWQCRLFGHDWHRTRAGSIMKETARPTCAWCGKVKPYAEFDYVVCGKCEGTGRVCKPVMHKGRKILASVQCPPVVQLTAKDARELNR